MAKSEKFNASINFGASIDSSLGKSLKWLTSGIEDTEKTTLKAMGVQTKWMKELQSGSASTTSKMKVMEQSMGALVKKQEALETKIRAGVRAGEDVSKLTDQYKTIAVGISRAEKELERLNAQREKEVKLEQKQANAAKRAERFMAMPGQALRGAGHLTGGAARGILHIGKLAAAGLIGGAAATIASPIALNEQTAEAAGLAKSYGLGIEQYQAMGIMAKKAGLNAENAGDLVEEATNKVFESGNEKTLNPMLRQLGLVKSQLTKMNRQDVFNLLMSRLSGMKDAGAAASLADQLMGGEGNKFLTYIKSTGKSFERSMKDAQRYNLLTQEGAEGAVKANTAVSNLWSVAVTGMEDVVGKITGQMAPMVDSAASNLAGWIKQMEPKITQAVTDWLKPDISGETGPERLWDNVVRFGKGIGQLADEVVVVADKLGFLLPSKTSTQGTSEEIRNSAYSMAYNAGMAEADKTPGIDNPWKFWTAGNRSDFVDEYAREHAETFETMLGAQDTTADNSNIPLAKPGSTTTNHNTFQFNVTIAGGTPTDMAKDFHNEFQKLVGGTGYSPTFDKY